MDSMLVGFLEILINIQKYLYFFVIFSIDLRFIFIDTNILYIFLLHIETKYFFFADTNFHSVENQRIHEVERKRAYSLDPNDYLCIQREEIEKKLSTYLCFSKLLYLCDRIIYQYNV